MRNVAVELVEATKSAMVFKKEQSTSLTMVAQTSRLMSNNTLNTTKNSINRKRMSQIKKAASNKNQNNPKIKRMLIKRVNNTRKIWQRKLRRRRHFVRKRRRTDSHRKRRRNRPDSHRRRRKSRRDCDNKK